MSSTSLTVENRHLQQADELCRRMQTIRHEMRSDLKGFVGEAERLLSWRYYVTHHPWKLVALAAGLGAYVAWRWYKSPATVATALPAIPAATAKPPKPKRRTAFLNSLLLLGADTALRAALAYFVQHLGTMVEQCLAKDQPSGGETALAGWPRCRDVNGQATADVRRPLTTAEAAITP